MHLAIALQLIGRLQHQDDAYQYRDEHHNGDGLDPGLVHETQHAAAIEPGTTLTPGRHEGPVQGHDKQAGNTRQVTQKPGPLCAVSPPPHQDAWMMCPTASSTLSAMVKKCSRRASSSTICTAGVNCVNMYGSVRPRLHFKPSMSTAMPELSMNSTLANTTIRPRSARCTSASRVWRNSGTLFISSVPWGCTTVIPGWRDSMATCTTHSVVWSYVTTSPCQVTHRRSHYP